MGHDFLRITLLRRLESNGDERGTKTSIQAHFRTLFRLSNLIFAGSTVAVRILLGGSEIDLNHILNFLVITSPSGPFCLKQLLQFVIFGGKLSRFLLNSIQFFLDSIILILGVISK